MTDITLVNAVFPSDVKVPPHGLLYLTAALERAGFSVEVRDYQLCHLDDPWEPMTFARFVEGSADILGISCMSYALPLVTVAAGLIKKCAEPEKFIALGGIGPSGVAEPLMKFCQAIDAIVVGEGELTAVELVDCILHGKDLATVDGIVYRGNDCVRRTRPRVRIPSLTELPWPTYERVDFSAYRLVDIQYGRGCPYQCSFCDIAPYWDRKHTRRPMDHFLDELEILVNVHGVKDVFIIDDTFVLSREAVLRFCDGVLWRKLKFEWGCYARVDLMDDQLMDRMAKAGCVKVFYGVEAGSDPLLKDITKGITVTQNIGTVLRSLEHFPFVTTSFVWGFPTETLDDLKQTAYLLIYLASSGACPQLNLVIPYSYSALYNQYRNHITFSPEYSSQLQFYEGSDREWMFEMIAAHPELFSVFYQLTTGAFEEKWQFLHDLGLSPHELQRAYFL